MNLEDLSKLETNAISSSQFDAILKFVSQIKDAKFDDSDEIDTIEMCDLRPDTVRTSLPREAVLQNAPRTDGEYFIVPKVVE